MASAVVDVCDSGAMETAITPPIGHWADRRRSSSCRRPVIPEPVGAYTQESWDAVLDVNLRAQALQVQLLLPHPGSGPRREGRGTGRRRHLRHRGTGRSAVHPYCAGGPGSSRRCGAVPEVRTGFEQSRAARYGSSAAGRESPTRWLSDVTEGVVHHRHIPSRRRWSDEQARVNSPPWQC